jgi:hypothetical protein
VIRQMLRLAVEAAKIEASRLVTALAPPGVPVPTSEPAPIAEPVAVQPPPSEPAPASKWSSPAFHVETLKSTTCPDCDGPKKVGWYRCPKCTAVAQKAMS